MRTRSLIATAAVAVVLLAGCGSSGSDAGGSDGGSDKSSAATTTAPAGDSSDAGGDITVPGTVEIPEGFPEAFTPPSESTLTDASTIGDAGTSFVVVSTITGDAEDAFNALQSQVVDVGYEVLGAQFTESPQGGYGGFSARGEDYTAAITFGPDPTGTFSTVRINVAPAA